jgi:predicted RNA-binding Zn-ribbon protein involved in translation (DUF1610 family)
MLKCPICGNKERFRAWQKCNGRMRVAVNGEGEWITDIHNNEMDYETYGPFICTRCGTEVEDK